MERNMRKPRAAATLRTAIYPGGFAPGAVLFSLRERRNMRFEFLLSESRDD